MPRSQIVKGFLLLASLAPLLLLAYMGQFSRLMLDDYIYLSVGRELGPWEAILYWRNTWNGAYTDQLLHVFFARFGGASPRILPAIHLSAWLLALTLLLHTVLSCLNVRRHRIAIALPAAALTVVAGVNAFHSQQSIYWYTASVAYSLPLAAFIIFLVFLVRSIGVSVHRTKLLPSALAGFVYCFLTAGISAMFMVFQGSVLATLIVPATRYARRTRRTVAFALIAAGLAATTVSFLVQITAPGIALRQARISPVESVSKRALPDLLRHLTENLYWLGGQEETFAGFIMLFGFGLFAALILHRAPTSANRRRPAALARAPLSCGLIVQLIFVPILWMHTSDQPAVLGRFSYAYITVIALNLALLLVFLLLLWQRRRIGRLLVENRNTLLMLSGGVLLVVLVLFAGAHIRSIHHRAARFLFSTATLLIATLAWDLALTLDDEQTKLYGRAVLLFAAACVFSYILMIAIPLYTLGKINGRITVPAVLMHVSLGLLLGAYIGYLIGQTGAGAPDYETWIRRIGLSGLAATLVIAAGITLGQARFIPDLQTFAREWDERERMIISQREGGHLDVVVAPLTFDLTWHLLYQSMSKGESGSAARYYGVDSISVREADA